MGDEALTSTGAGGSSLGQRLRRGTRALVREAGAAFLRTPLEVLLGAVAAVGLSFAIQWRAVDGWTPLLVTVGTALPLVYAASALHARGLVGANVRWAVSGAAIVACALYGFFVFDVELEAEEWRARLLAGAAYALLLCVPLVRPAGERRAAAYAFGARFFVRAAIVGVYAGALYLGLVLAFLAINALFELHLGGRALGHLAAALFVLLPPWAVAAGLPDLLRPPGRWHDPALVALRRIGAFLLAPLVYVYLGIVYAYTVRVLVTGEVPKNMVSPVVIGAGVLIVAGTIALEPTHDDERAGGLSFLLRLAAPLLLPLVLFATWAVSTRVDQYGWTEFRYLRLLVLVLLAVYAAAALYRLGRRRRPPLAVVPAVLAGVLLLAAVGPWSAAAVARRSQTGALRELLAGAGKTATGGDAAVPDRTLQAVNDKGVYIERHFGWATLRRTVPWITGRADRYAPAALYASRMGLVPRIGPEMTRAVSASVWGSDTGYPGIGGGTLYRFSVGLNGVPPRPRRYPVERSRPAPPALRVLPDQVAGQLVLLPPTGEELIADLRPLARTLLERTASSKGEARYEPRRTGRPVVEVGRSFDASFTPAEAVLPVLTTDGRPAGQVVLEELHFERLPGGGVVHIQFAAGMAVLAPPVNPARRTPTR